MTDIDRRMIRPTAGVVSDHTHPVPLLRWLTAILLALGIAGAGFGVVGLVVMGIWHGLPLLPVMAMFLVILSLPLVQLAVMHPRVTVYEDGLWLNPVLWRSSWIPWDAIGSVEKHTLIRHVVNKRGKLERDGRLIVAEGLPWPYQIVSGMAGLGWRARAFGIATNAHTDYPALLNAIQHHKRH
ncbi:MAG: hypothetical protein JW966_11165 [Anaerolineae bacterium]|nr:hypothetical protein [Anaerolineae bacterium]